MKLTEKQKRFCEEYLLDWNATQAYRRAGYQVKSDNAAAVNARRLLAKEPVREYLKERQALAQERTEITTDRILKEYAKLAFFDPRKLFHGDGRPKRIEELDEDTAACITALDVSEVYEGRGEKRELSGYIKKYRLADRKGALDSLAKHLGICVDQVRVNQSISHQLDPEVLEAMLEAAGYVRSDQAK